MKTELDGDFDVFIKLNIEDGGYHLKQQEALPL
jgi:hypothetical protein